MFVNINSHIAKENKSSAGIFFYLDKENTGRNKRENYFNQDYNPITGENGNIGIKEAYHMIDNNRNTKRSNLEANFYMINFSPSQKEQEHMLSTAEKELERRGMKYSEYSKNPELMKYYQEQKDEMMKVMMKLYIKDMMNEYAKQMDREIYVNQEGLPNDAERKRMRVEIEKRWENFLEERKVIERKIVTPIEKREVEHKGILKEMQNGKIYSIHINYLGKNMPIYIPNNRMEALTDNKISVESFYLEYKLEECINKEIEKTKLVNIYENVLSEEIKYETFQDLIKEETFIVEIKLEGIKESLDLYLKGVQRDDKGNYTIRKDEYLKQIRNTKIRALKKEYSDIYQSFLEKEIAKNFTFIKDEQGNFIFDKKEPTKKEWREIEMETGVEFNKLMEEKGLLEKPTQIRIEDWDTTQTFDLDKIKVNAKTSKSYNITIEVENKNYDFWVSQKFLEINEKDCKINKEYLEKKIEEINRPENSEIIFIEDPQIITTQKEVERTEFVHTLKIEHPYFKSPIEFKVAKSDLIEGKYLEKQVFKNKFDYQIYRQAKTEYKEIFDEIKKEVEEKKLKEKPLPEIEITNEEVKFYTKTKLEGKELLIYFDGEKLEKNEKGEVVYDRKDFEKKWEALQIQELKKEYKEIYQEVKKEINKREDKLINKVFKDKMKEKGLYKELNPEYFGEKESEKFIVKDLNRTLTQEEKRHQEEVNKEIEIRFRNYLYEEKILEKEKIKEMEVKVESERKDSYFISYKPENYHDKINFWVNKNEVHLNEEKNVMVMEEKRAEKLIENAIERDKEQKTMVEIQYDNLEIKEIENKKTQETEKQYIFSQKKEGLEEEIKISFMEKDLKIEEEKFYVEKFKLEYRENSAKEREIEEEYGKEKERIKNEVWEENGYDTTKRQLTGDDLLYFGKVETERTYKHDDKLVLKNKDILEKIWKESEKKKPNQNIIAQLKTQLERDKYTGEIIKEGIQKGGLNYHAHVVVSRHDRTSKNREDKVSMSPNAHHKDGKMKQGAKVGFNRDAFAQTAEKVFDEKFEYNRPVWEKYTILNKTLKEAQGKLKGEIKGRIKKFIEEHTGLNRVKQELDFRQKIKNEIMPIPLPTSLPKSKLDLLIKIAKTIKNIIDKGQEINI